MEKCAGSAIVSDVNKYLGGAAARHRPPSDSRMGTPCPGHRGPPHSRGGRQGAPVCCTWTQRDECPSTLSHHHSRYSI